MDASELLALGARPLVVLPLSLATGLALEIHPTVGTRGRDGGCGAPPGELPNPTLCRGIGSARDWCWLVLRPLVAPPFCLRKSQSPWFGFVMQRRPRC